MLHSKRYGLEFSSFYLNEKQKIHIFSKEREKRKKNKQKTDKKQTRWYSN